MPIPEMQNLQLFEITLGGQRGALKGEKGFVAAGE